MKCWVGGEWEDDVISLATCEILAELQETIPRGRDIHLVLTEASVVSESVSTMAAGYGATSIWATASSDMVNVISRLAVSAPEKDDLLAFPATDSGAYWAARVAADLGRDLIPDVDSLHWGKGQWILTRSVGGLKMTAEVPGEKGLTVVSWHPGARGLRGWTMTPDSEVAWVQLIEGIAPSEERTFCVARGSQQGEDLDVRQAKVVVAGGRGMGTKKDFEALSELAQRLGGSVGATRVAVDRGWAPFSRQIGSTGKAVAPVLYVACGISGAVQHMMGIRDAKNIVAINTDPTAPIMLRADLALVGDAKEVVQRVLGILDQLVDTERRQRHVQPTV